MRFDFERMDATERFEFLTAAVVPRPNAIVAALDARGRLNAAHSVFGLMAVSPNQAEAPHAVDTPGLLFAVDRPNWKDWTASTQGG